MYIPSNTRKDVLAKVLAHHYNQGSQELVHKRVSWTASHCWLQGLRPITNNRGRSTFGLPSEASPDIKGNKRIRVEHTMMRAVAEIGRILRIDTGLTVDRQGGLGLSQLRSESMAQAVFDAGDLLSNDPQRRICEAYAIVTYGMTGVAVQSRFRGKTYLPSVGLIPPWELRPLPGGVYMPTEASGFSWSQWVSLGWLKKFFGGQYRFPSDTKKLFPRKMIAGNKFKENAPWSVVGYSGAGATGTGKAPEPDKKFSEDTDAEMELLVELRQHWIMAEDGELAHHIVTLGPDWVAQWANFVEGELAELADEDPVSCPVGIVRYNTVGSWYGRSFVERVRPIDDAFERLYSDTIKNMRDTNQMRKVWFPLSGGFNKRNFNANGNNSYGFWSPDITAARVNPFVVDPANNGDANLRTLMATSQMMEQVSGQSDIMFGQTKRLESAGGVAMAQQASEVTIIQVAESLDSAYRQVGRAMLGYAKARLNPELFPGTPETVNIKLSKMDETVLGLRIDPATGQVGISASSIPMAKEIAIRIRNKVPLDKDRILRDIRDRVAVGLLSPVEADILYVVKGLDVPNLRRDYYNQYQLAWLENLILFGDGETPGTIRTISLMDNHGIHYMFHHELAASAVVRYGTSRQVLAKLTNHTLEHKRTTGWPDNLAIPSQFRGPVQIPPGAVEASGGMPVGSFVE